MSTTKNRHFIIIAGESSGDIYGAKLIEHIQKENRAIAFSGLGGTKMQALGFTSLFPINLLAVMGFWEVLKKIFFFIRVEKELLNHIQKIQPEKIILIDYPGLNLRLAQKIKNRLNTKIIYYISPQFWAWKPKRVKIIKKYIDTMIVLFPFEIDWYQKHNITVEYFGHPLVGSCFNPNQKILEKKPAYRIALCPGSRKQEIKAHMPVLSNVIKRAQNIHANIHFDLFCAPNIPESLVRRYPHLGEVKIHHTPILESFNQIDFAVVASGTASLECATTATPMVVIYKMSWMSWKTTKFFVNSPYASIINILANKKIVEELLQVDCNSENIIAAINNFVATVASSSQHHELIKTMEPLALKNTYEKTSQYILHY